MANISLPANGQTLTDIPDYIANDDQLLRDLLSPTMPDLANATFERKTTDGLLTVTVSKRAGTKGGEAAETAIPHIAFPLAYDHHGQFILDAMGRIAFDVRGWGHLEKLPNGIEAQDAIGQWAATTLNQAARQNEGNDGDCIDDHDMGGGF